VRSTASSVQAIDEMSQELLNRSQPFNVPREYWMQIEGAGIELFARQQGQVVKTITSQDLQKLPKAVLEHVMTRQQAMMNHYKVWAEVHPQLALLSDPIAKAQLSQRLDEIVIAMKDELLSILDFLETCGFELDDHYLEVRDVIKKR